MSEWFFLNDQRHLRAQNAEPSADGRAKGGEQNKIEYTNWRGTCFWPHDAALPWQSHHSHGWPGASGSEINAPVPCV